MKFIKKHFGAILFISAILVIDAVLWITRMKSDYYNSASIITSVSGATLLMGFFLVFLLSTRMKWVVKIFGGLDGVYFWHRILAISTTAMIFVHGLLSENVGVFNSVNVFILGPSSGAGELARNLFLFLIAFALLAKFFKYEHFRFIHRFLVIPYIFSLYHGFFSSWVNLFSVDVLPIWMISTSVIGLSSALYMLFIYQFSAFSNKGIIVDKKLIHETIIELKVKMKKQYHFKAGQFAFIKIDKVGISSASHPFSISGQDGDYIYFTIKNLGDFTKSLLTNLDTPVRINITKPYGSMTFNSKTKKQLWIAGGIGVTPFLGYLRSENQISTPTHLIYTVNQIEEAVHLETFHRIANSNPNFHFTLFESTKQGFLSCNNLDLDDDTTVYMCGPRPMVQSLNKQMKVDYPDVKVHFEAFSFTGTLIEDLLRFIKKAMRKLKPVKTK